MRSCAWHMALLNRYQLSLLILGGISDLWQSFVKESMIKEAQPWLRFFLSNWFQAGAEYSLRRACKNFMQPFIECGSDSYITHWRSAMDGQQVHWVTVDDSSDTSYRQMTWPPSLQWPTSWNRKSVFADSPSRHRGLQSRLPTLQAVRGNTEPHGFPSTGELLLGLTSMQTRDNWVTCDQEP